MHSVTILDSTLKLPTIRLTMEYSPNSQEPSRLTFTVNRLEFAHIMGTDDFDRFVALHCPWGSDPLSVDCEGLYVLFATGRNREVAIAELGDVFPQLVAMADELRFVGLVPPKKIQVFPNRLSNTVKKHFPDFHAAQSLDHARAVIAKLDRRAPKPRLKKPKPPLTRLANERWWRNQTRPSL